MLSTILNDLSEAITMVLNFSNLHMTLAMLAISLFTGLRMGGYGHIFGAVMESTLLLALFSYLWNWLSTPGRFSLDVWEAESVQSWNNLMAINGKVLIGYLATFFIFVTVVYLIKAFANR